MSFLSTDKPKPQILDVRITAQTKVFQIQSVDLQFANGQHRTYERLTPSRRPAVMVMALEGDNLLMATNPSRWKSSVCRWRGWTN